MMDQIFYCTLYHQLLFSLQKYYKQFFMLQQLELIKQQGNSLFKSKKYQQAREKFDQAIQKLILDPTHTVKDSNLHKLYVNLLTNCALCALNLKEIQQYKLAIEYCNQALATDPQNLKALYRRGLANKQLGQLLEQSQTNPNHNEIIILYKRSKQDLEKLTLLDRENKIAEQKLSQTIKNFYRIKLITKEEIQIKKQQPTIQSHTEQKQEGSKTKVHNLKKSNQAMMKIMKDYKVEEVTKLAHQKIQEGILTKDLPKNKTQFQKAIKTIEKSQIPFFKFNLRLEEAYLLRIDPNFDTLHKIFFNIAASPIQETEITRTKQVLRSLSKCKSFQLFWKSLLKNQKQKIRCKVSEIGGDKQQWFNSFN